MISVEQFAHDDPTDMYKQMRPDQWTAIANEFLRVLKIAGDPQVDRFAHEFAPAAQQATPTSVLKTLDQAVAVHMYTRDHYPDLFADVAHHPVTLASLQAPGAPVVAEESAEEKAFIVGPDSDMDRNTFAPDAPAYTLPRGYSEGDIEPPHKGEHLPDRDEWGEQSI